MNKPAALLLRAAGFYINGYNYLKYQKDNKIQPPALDRRYTRKYIKCALLNITFKKLRTDKYGRSHNKNI